MNKLYPTWFFLLFFFSLTIKAQQELYSNRTTSSIRLMLDYKNGKFTIIDKNESEYGDDVEISNILGGSLKVKNNEIICVVGFNVYRLRKISDEVLINNNLPYFGKYLYIIGRNKLNSKREFLGSWKDGSKDGYWWFWDATGRRYYILYKDGKVIKKGFP